MREIMKAPIRLVSVEPHEYEIKDSQDHQICSKSTDDAAKDAEETEVERLAYIVKCVNAHEALVEALREIAALEGMALLGDPDHGGFNSEYNRAYQQGSYSANNQAASIAKTALSLAEGK